VKKIHFEQPVINALVKEDGTANWDITLPSGDGSSAEGESSSPLLIKLRKISISDARVVYDDASLVTFVLLEGVNHSLSGDFTMDFTSLKTKTFARHATVVYDGIKYFNKVEMELDADIDADLANSIYTLKDNQMRVNQLYLGFDGSVALLENDDISMMLTYNAKKSDFKNFLSLVPAIYSRDFESIQTSGSLSLSGNVKGIYNETTYPAFALDLKVDNGKFQYPDLPKAVDDINIHTKIVHPGGDFDNMTIDVSEFRFKMAGNPFDFSLLVKTPMSDPQLKGKLDGEIILSNISEVYPLDEGDELQGKLISRVSFEGKMSSLENEKYEEFQFLGSLLMEGVKYKTGAIEKPVLIEKAQLNFSPAYIDLVNFKMNIASNDLSATGKIENFMPYVFGDGILMGKLETGSEYFNLTELMPESEAAPEEATSQDLAAEDTSGTISATSIEIPGNINFSLNSNFKQLIYDNIEMNNVVGVIIIRDKAVVLNKLRMDILEGTANLSGKFDTKNPEEPTAEVDFAVTNIDIQKAYSTFEIMEKLLPVAEKTQGTFSTTLSLNTLLDNELNPVYNSMNGGGKLNTSSITIENLNTLSKLADLIKMPDLKRLKSGPINLSYEFIDGRVQVQPFDFNYQDMKANLGGSTGFDQSIDYDMKLTVPREKFGGQANAVLDNLISQANTAGANFSVGETIDLNIKIGGTLTNPQLKTGVPGSSGNMKEDLKKKAKEEIEKEIKKEIEETKGEAKAKADKILMDAKTRADKIMSDARAQADQWNKEAENFAQQAKDEARKQADQILEEAKKDGALAEMAAKASTDKLLDEANKNAGKIVEEAKKRSDNLLKEAQQQADNINNDARQQADDVLDGN
jgi:vacuolar-type H+-ATPase subunit H